MDARTLALDTFDKTLRQFLAAVEGFPAAAAEAKLTEQGMTAREMALHMAECRAAIVAGVEGRDHEWGSFQPAEGETAEAGLKRLHDEAKAAAAAAVDAEAAAKMVMDFGTMHDAYHVGQIVLLRLQHEPEWDSYAIYA